MTLCPWSIALLKFFQQVYDNSTSTPIEFLVWKDQKYYGTNKSYNEDFYSTRNNPYYYKNGGIKTTYTCLKLCKIMSVMNKDWETRYKNNNSYYVQIGFEWGLLGLYVNKFCFIIYYKNIMYKILYGKVIL